MENSKALYHQASQYHDHVEDQNENKEYEQKVHNKKVAKIEYESALASLEKHKPIYEEEIRKAIGLIQDKEKTRLLYIKVYVFNF